MAKTIEFLDNRYQVYVTPQARQKMEMYCDLSEGEIGWLGYVEDMGAAGFLIADVALLKQEVHATTTEITPEGLLEFWNATPAEDHCKIKIWGHSHVNMGVTPSSQDNEQMAYFKEGNPWFIRLITNKKREYYIDVYDYLNGIKVHCDQADLKDYNPAADAIRTTIEAEIKEKVSKKEYKSTTSSSTTGASKYLPTYKSAKKTEKKYDLPLLNAVNVKVVSSLDDVLDDPHYWQAFAA